jgi:hypothetical protein
MRILRSSLGVFVLVGSALLSGGCGGDGEGSGEAAASGAGAVTFEAQAEPLGGFSFDTGLIPKGSPAQVSLKVSAGGNVKVVAVGERGGAGLTGKAGGGKLSLDLHVKMDGRLKIDSPLKKIDDALPGLKDVDVPITGEIPFEPFMLGEGESAQLAAAIPETKLPPIPLGSVPGKLEITVTGKSAVKSSFSGTCMSVAGGQASYNGIAKTSGWLVLKGRLLVELPMPLDKAIDLGEIMVPIPASTTALAFEAQDVAGVADGQTGSACEAPGASGGTPSGGTTNGGTTSGGTTSGDTEDGGTGGPVELTGSLAMTDWRSFGDATTCQYRVHLENLQVKAQQASDGTLSHATITATAIEQIVGTCKDAAAPPDNLRYEWAPGGSSEGTFTSDPSNRTQTKLSGVLRPSRAWLEWNRTDVGPPLNWYISADVPLAPAP